MNKQIFFVALYMSISLHAMDNYLHNKVGQTVPMSMYDLEQKKFVLKSVDKDAYDHVGRICDNKLLTAQRKLLFKKCDEGFNNLQCNKYDEALKKFKFALSLFNQLPYDPQIFNETMHVMRKMADIYRIQKKYDQAEAYLKALINQGNVPAYIALTTVLEEQMKTANSKKKTDLKKKIKELYACAAATGDDYAKARYAHLSMQEGQVDRAVKDFSVLLTSRNPSVKSTSLRGLQNCVSNKDLRAQCALITNIKHISNDNTKLVDMFGQMLKNFTHKLSKQCTNIPFEDVFKAIDVFEHFSNNSERARLLLGQAYYESALVLPQDQQRQQYKKAWHYLRKINTPKALCYKLYMYIHGLGIHQSIEMAYAVFKQLEQSKEGLQALGAVFSVDDLLLVKKLKKCVQNGGKKAGYAAYILACYYVERDVKIEYMYWQKALAPTSPVHNDPIVRCAAAACCLVLKKDKISTVQEVLRCVEPVLCSQKTDEKMRYKALALIDNLNKYASGTLIKKKRYDLCYQIIMNFLQDKKALVPHAFELMRKVEDDIRDSKNKDLLILVKKSGVYNKLVYWANKNNPDAYEILSLLHLHRGYYENKSAYLLGGDGIKDIEKGLSYYKKMMDLHGKNTDQKDINDYCDHCNRLACMYWNQGNKKKALECWDKAAEYDYQQALITQSKVLMRLNATIKENVPLIKKGFDLAEQLVAKNGMAKFPVEFLESQAQYYFVGLNGVDDTVILPVDKVKSFKYAWSAAKRGGKVAHRILADFYKTGFKNKDAWIIKPNKEKVFAHYTKAIELGDRQSLFCRGKIYYDQKKFDNALGDFYAVPQKIKPLLITGQINDDDKKVLAFSSWYMAKMSLSQKGDKEHAINMFYNAFKLFGRTGNVAQLFEHMSDNDFLLLEQTVKDIVAQQKKTESDLELCYYIGYLLHKNKFEKIDQQLVFKQMGLGYLRYAADNGDIWSAWYLGHVDKQNVDINDRYNYLWQVFKNKSNEELKYSAVGCFKVEAELGYMPAIAYLFACYAQEKRFKDIENFLGEFYCNHEALLCYMTDKLTLKMLQEYGALDYIKGLANKKHGIFSAQYGAKLILGCMYISYAEKTNKEYLDNAIKYLKEVQAVLPAKDNRMQRVKQVLGEAYYKMGLHFEHNAQREKVTHLEYAKEMKHALHYWNKSLRICTHIRSQYKIVEGCLDGLWKISNIDQVINSLRSTLLFNPNRDVMFVLGRYYLEKTTHIKMAQELLTQAKKMGYPGVDEYMTKAADKIKKDSQRVKNIARLTQKRNEPVHISLDPQDIGKLISQEKSPQANNAQYKQIKQLANKSKYKQVRKKLEALARKGHPHACIRLASYYLTGKGRHIKANRSSAIYYLEKGLNNGALTKDKKYLDREIANLILQPFAPLKKSGKINDRRKGTAFWEWTCVLAKKDAPKANKKG